MKYSLVTVLSIVFNVLLTKGQTKVNEKNLANDYPLTDEFTQAISFNSILEDINNFYNQNNNQQPQIIANPNVKAQVASGSDDSGSAKSEETNSNTTSDTASTNNNTSNSSGNSDTSTNTGNSIASTNTGNSNASTNTGNGNASTNTGNSNTSTNTGNDKAGSSTTNDKNDKSDNNGETKEDEDDELKLINEDNDGNDEEHNEGDGCEHNRDSLGMFAFHKPVKRSILVVNSNFTIVWYYNKILPGYTYNYPSNNITFKLYYEDDSNPNNWGLNWGNPVFERTVPLSEIEDGPTFNGIKTYQYNWEVIAGTDHGFRQSPKYNEKYRLRIYGDDKDAQSNQANFKCYDDGDITPGLTVTFYLVENKRDRKSVV